MDNNVHKWQKEIIAWASGVRIQGRIEGANEPWRNINFHNEEQELPPFNDPRAEFRIKPQLYFQVNNALFALPMRPLEKCDSGELVEEVKNWLTSVCDVQSSSVEQIITPTFFKWAERFAAEVPDDDLPDDDFVLTFNPATRMLVPVEQSLFDSRFVVWDEQVQTPVGAPKKQLRKVI